jgi:hypothetical protein
MQQHNEVKEIVETQQVIDEEGIANSDSITQIQCESSQVKSKEGNTETFARQNVNVAIYFSMSLLWQPQ